MLAELATGSMCESIKVATAGMSVRAPSTAAGFMNRSKKRSI